MWLKGSSGVLELTAAPDYNEDTNMLIRGFGIRGAYINVCVDSDPLAATDQADLDQLDKLSLLQMKKSIDEETRSVIDGAYEPDDKPLEIEVIVNWTLAF